MMTPKRYRYHYQSIIRFSAPVDRHYFRLRCMPADTDFQQLSDQVLSMHPAVSVRHTVDAFGNRVQYGHTLEPHDAFVFSAGGVALQTDYRIADPSPWTPYRLESRLTAGSDALIQCARSFGTEADVALRAEAIAHAVHAHMAYTPGTTAVDTTAAQAFAIGRGVCQDYAHVFIALCRLTGIAARYVSGFIPGIGFTHAWAEVHDGAAWIGFDPTNDCRAGCGYIKLAHGRDAADCPVNRGVFVGGVGQSSEVRVLVEELQCG